MNWRVSRSLLLAATFLGPVAAQQGGDCPGEMASPRPASITNGPPGPCTGTDYEIGGVSVTTRAVIAGHQRSGSASRQRSSR